jgi:hypothetical protein
MGPDISRVTVIADNVEAIDWTGARDGAAAFNAAPSKTFDDGSVWNPLKSLLDAWQPHEPGLLHESSRPLQEVIEALDISDIESFRAVIEQDLQVLEGMLTGEIPVLDNDGYNGGGFLQRVGEGAALSAEVDLRNPECLVDSPYEVLSRLSSTKLFDDNQFGFRIEQS